MNRRVASAAGAMLLIGVGTLTSPAFSQGPMAPRMDVAPPPRVAPPPPPPVFVPPVVPTPPPMPVAPVMAPPPPPPAPKAPTATAPATPTPATPAPVATPTPTPPPPPATGSPAPRTTASAPLPYADSQVKALRDVGVGMRGPGGNRQVTSDSNGVVSLGKLGPGRHELTVNRKSLGTGTGTAPLPGGQPVALIGLLLPAVQGVRYVSTNVPPVNDPDEQVQIKVEVDARGRVSRIDWGGGKASINVAVGDVNGDGRTDLKHFEDLAKRNTSGETWLVFVTPVPGSTARLGTTPGNPTGPGSPTAQEATISQSGAVIAQEAIINTSRDNIKKPPAKLPDVGVTATGPNGTQQLRSDGGGWTRLGKLAVGNTVIEFSGTDLASALTKTGTPTTPTAQQKEGSTGIIIGVVAAARTDGTVAVFTGSVPASAVKSLKADLRIGRDGNAMEANWGNGQQLPQILPKTGTATLTVPGPNGPIPLDPAFVKSLQDRFGGNAPGLVESNTLLQEVSTTPQGTSPGNPAGPGTPSPNYQNNPIPGINVVVKKQPAGSAITQNTSGDGTTTLGVLTPGTHSVALDTKKLLDVRIPGPSGSEPAQPAGILIGLLLPAVQKLGEAPQPTTVERTFPRSVLASKRELQIDIVIPDGGGSPKVDWGDGSPTTDVGRDGVPAPSGLRISADVATIRVQNY